MMIASLVPLLLNPPSPQPARLVGASLFKNGFAVVQRIVDVPTPGSTVVVPIPQGAMGTLWFTPTDGLNLDSVVVENGSVTSQSIPLASLDAILQANVGRTVTLTLKETETSQKLTARLVSASGTIVVVETAVGTRVVSKAAILGVEGKGLKASGQFTMGGGRIMRLRTLGKPGRVSIVSLERGLTWTPAYAVDLQPDGKTLVLVAKATIVNDLERLSNLDCRFVTGFPNLAFADTLDPLISSVVNAPGGFPGGGLGGFGGGGGFGGQSAALENRRGQNVGYNDGDRALAAAAQAPDGDYRGELFFYHRPNVSVDLGGRGAYTLFRTTTPYETIYAWDLSDPAPGASTFQPRIVPLNSPNPEEVWQTLRFVNNAKLPFTTGPATTFSGSEILGQDTLKYASAGQTAELRVTRSLDLSPDFVEEETGRERGFVKRPDNDPIYDRVTVRGTLTLTNRKAKAVKVRIRKSFTGEWISGDGDPTVTATAAGLRQPNPTGLAEWTKTVEPGATLKLTYTTRLLVSS